MQKEADHLIQREADHLIQREADHLTKSEHVTWRSKTEHVT